MTWRLDRARALAAKGAKRSGSAIRMPCPLHGGEDPLVLRETGSMALWHCHAGCDWQDVRDALIEAGILTGGKEERMTGQKKRKKTDEVAQWIVDLWSETVPLHEALPGYAYLRGRAIDDRTIQDGAYNNLRWHHGRHALVGRVSDPAGTRGMGIHVTTLRKHPLEVMHRKFHGPVGSGVIKLFRGTELGERVVLAEGVETALSVRQLLDRVGVSDGEHGPVWAALSAGGIERFRPPAGVKEIAVAADLDGAGLTAYERLARTLRATHQVHLMLPGNCEKHHRRDFNDVLAELARTAGF